MFMEDEVRAGMAWLDERKPGWTEKLDLIQLDLGGCESCVIGQLDMSDGWDFSDDELYNELGGYPPELGFDLPFNKNDYNNGAALAKQKYEDLTETWKTLIRQRKDTQSNEAQPASS